LGKIHARRPGLAQCRGGGSGEAWKTLDAIELAEVNGHGLGDRGLQRVRIDRLQKTTRQTSRKMLYRQRLQPMAPRDRGFPSGAAPCKT
jgi:hypothetical protein